MKPKSALTIFLLAAGLFAFHVVLTRRWVATDRQPPGWDASVHLGTAMDYRQAWRERRWPDLLLTQSRPGHPRYPPLSHYSMIAVLSHPRPHIIVAWLNLGYFMALVLISSWIAWSMAGTWAAATTLLILGLSPQLLYDYREAFPDFSLALWVAAAYALLPRSQLYEKRTESLWLGVCAGLAACSKWSAIAYLFPCWLAGLQDKKRRRNLLLATAAAALVCAPWYLLNGVQMIPRFWTSLLMGQEQGLPEVWSWASGRFYADLLARCFSWPGLILLILGAILAVRRGWSARRWKSGEVWLAGWAAFSLLFTTLTPNKHWRYFLPAATVIPILGTAGLPAPVLALSAAIALSHGRDIRASQPGNWHVEEMLAEIESRLNHRRSLASLCLLANHRNLNSNNLNWMARHAGLSGVYVGCEQSEIPEWADFVLAKTGDPGVFLADKTLSLLAQAVRGGRPFTDIFSEARRWPLPDGSEAILYAQRRDWPRLSRPMKIPEVKIRSARLQNVRITPRGGDRYEVAVSTAILEKLDVPIRGLRVLLEGARLFTRGGKIYVLGLDKVTLLSAELLWADLSRGLSARSRARVDVGAEDGDAWIAARLGPLVLRASFTATARDGELRLNIRRARAAGLPIPGAGSLHWKRSLVPAPPYQPYALEIKPIRFLPEGLRIGVHD